MPYKYKIVTKLLKFRKNKEFCHRSRVYLFTEYLFKIPDLSYILKFILFAIKITAWAAGVAQLLEVFLELCSPPEIKEHTKRTLTESLLLP